MNGVQIRIRGKVQGVGFRPFVWQLARAQARCGDVCNDGDGVLVRLVGGDDGFTAALADHCPPLARIDSTACIPYRWRPRRRISPSARAGRDGCALRLCPMPRPARRASRR
ncbi:hydrogenase metallocenter assembly protein HypF [Klebsiella pneumoniae]|uniref:acylphosphatase n=1 Tax=Klebsiella pneumoniae TaxID=573 RepID=A0A2X3CSU0_KLEPN|nr:hydrogenase metallocenter assembly protein HypF [Klebsiella pneumoniae]